ncbi:MAG: hypothetical protein Q4D88_00645 [Anaerococcus sp.]|nr:hypothetical protein [Anaerococcus sp.]
MNLFFIIEFFIGILFCFYGRRFIHVLMALSLGAFLASYIFPRYGQSPQSYLFLLGSVVLIGFIFRSFSRLGLFFLGIFLGIYLLKLVGPRINMNHFRNSRILLVLLFAILVSFASGKILMALTGLFGGFLIVSGLIGIFHQIDLVMGSRIFSELNYMLRANDLYRSIPAYILAILGFIRQNNGSKR